MDTKSPSSSSSSSRWKYHVFLSFRGEDTRNRFTDHLYSALKQKGIFTFRDNEKLEKGKSISLELLKAIEESLFAIVILSKNYASSTWCLDELVKILECRKKMGLIVVPIFYDLDPSTVRKQTGTYARAFVKHKRSFKDEKVRKWKVALTEVANLSGWSLQNRPESESIHEIVEVISHKLSYAFARDTKGLVGMDSRVEELKSLLAIGLNDVRIIGVWGMGGIGKTTLVRVVYSMVFNEFEGGSFINNIRVVSEKYDLIPLQQKLICEILMERSMNIRDDDHGALMIKNRLCHKRILLVLDDVNEFNQLEKLVGDPNWFGPGSRIIITTRDKHLLIRHKVYGIYEAKGLNIFEAFQLFSLKAFNKDQLAEDYLELCEGFVNYAKGLPLAIEVLGSFLLNRSKEDWESELDRLKEFPEEEINKILQISFDGLRETEKEIFLHIACFFNMKDKDYVVEILDCLGLYPKIGLSVLIEKSLLKEYENKFWMHELLQKMGQNIVRKVCPQEPGKWSKLWLYKDIHKVLMKNTGTKPIQGLVLELPTLPELSELHKSKEAHWNLEAVSKFPNLKLLIIHGVQLLHGPSNIPNGLRFFECSEYPSKSLPASFQPYQLVGLHMCHSKIEQLWKGIKHFDSLKSIKLEDSLNLIATPDLNEVPNLEKLVLKGCTNLRDFHQSILVHERLTLLNLEGCKNLNSLPSKFEAKSLEILILSGCSKIKKIPEFMKSMKRLSKLHLDGTAITELPSSVKHLTNLASLHLSDCKNLVCFPSIICGFESLKDLDLSGCSKLDNLPENLGNAKNLEQLDLSGIAIRELPPSMGRLSNLKDLSFRGCNNLLSPKSSTKPFCLPSLSELSPKPWNKLFSFYSSSSRIPNPVTLLLPFMSGLCSLTNLDLRYCNLNTIPNDFGSLSSLVSLVLSGNNLDSLPESMLQLSKLRTIFLENCTRLRSLPQLPSSTSLVYAHGNSLETLPNRRLDYAGGSDMFFRMLSRDAQGTYKAPKRFLEDPLSFVIPGNEISKWFSHRSVGTEVRAQVPSHLCNKRMGMAACLVFSYYNVDHPENKDLCEVLRCRAYVNEHPCDEKFTVLNKKVVQIKSHYLWLIYFPPQTFYENLKAVLSQFDKKESIQMKVSFEYFCPQCYDGVMKCAFRLVYREDIEDIREMMPQCSNNSCIPPYDGLDAQHNFNNPTLVTKIKRSHDDINGAGPSGEGSSHDVLHSKKRILS